MFCSDTHQITPELTVLVFYFVSGYIYLMKDVPRVCSLFPPVKNGNSSDVCVRALTRVYVCVCKAKANKARTFASFCVFVYATKWGERVENRSEPPQPRNSFGSGVQGRSVHNSLCERALWGTFTALESLFKTEHVGDRRTISSRFTGFIYLTRTMKTF